MAYPHSYLCTVNSDKQQLNLYIIPIMINRGKEMLRISPKDSKKIEYSTNQGRTWIVRYSGSSNTGALQRLDGCRQGNPWNYKQGVVLFNQ